MEKVDKILVLGSSGMLGHILVNVLESSKSFNVFNLARNRKINNQTLLCDVTNFSELENHIDSISPDYIINCVGVLINESSKDVKSSILINSYLPHYLDSLSERFKFKLIHISTDCVFSGKKGMYTENSKTDPIDRYGFTKNLGEVVKMNHLTIRTSIVGPELKKNGEGLLTWILKNKRGSIDGFTNSIWSGLTTIELSRAIIYCIKNNLNGLLHIYSSSIAKYDLIKIINDKFNLDIQINKVLGKNSNKSLISIRNDFNHKIPSHLEMISEMHEFIKNYKY